MPKPKGSAAGRVLVTAWVIFAAGVIPIPEPLGGSGAASAAPVPPAGPGIGITPAATITHAVTSTLPAAEPLGFGIPITSPA